MGTITEKSNEPIGIVQDVVKTETYERPDYNPSELVIKEMMLQKGVDRDRAIYLLKNPTK